ncbi:MAG: 2Fe-2S iron-sulfur cluster-binding protein, partial [Dongiaceae bacterium]
MNRLPAPAGRLLDRNKTIAFRFEGRAYEGFAGDTIASALAANDVWTLSRSFKYHRPRGILTMAGLDANTLVQIGDEPNVPADRRAISEGMVVEGQNYSGSLEHDRETWIEMFGRFLPPGFYYKAFYRPKGAWKFWEPFIRKRAGLGKVNIAAHHGYYEKEYLFADVAVIGGGPAGSAAALQAAEAGAEVILVDDGATLGGSLTYARFDSDGRRGRSLAAEAGDAIAAQSVIRGNRLYKLRAKASVIATGALEQPAVFRNNDLPGVMLGSAAQRLAKLYGVRPGREAVVVAANADGYAVAVDLAESGVAVNAIVDLRHDVWPSPHVTAAQRLELRIVKGSAVVEAVPTLGKRGVMAVRVARLDAGGVADQASESIPCDLLCMSVGYTPTSHLLHHLSAKFAYNKSTAMFEVASLPPHVVAAGSVAGTYNLDAVIQEGRRAGWLAARDAGLKTESEPAAPASKGNLGVTHP